MVEQENNYEGGRGEPMKTYLDNAAQRLRSRYGAEANYTMTDGRPTDLGTSTRFTRDMTFRQVANAELIRRDFMTNFARPCAAGAPSPSHGNPESGQNVNAPISTSRVQK